MSQISRARTGKIKFCLADEICQFELTIEGPLKLVPCAIFRSCSEALRTFLTPADRFEESNFRKKNAERGQPPRQESGRATSIVGKLEARMTRAASRSVMKFRSSPADNSAQETTGNKNREERKKPETPRQREKERQRYLRAVAPTVTPSSREKSRLGPGLLCVSSPPMSTAISRRSASQGARRRARARLLGGPRHKTSA